MAVYQRKIHELELFVASLQSEVVAITATRTPKSAVSQHTQTIGTSEELLQEYEEFKEEVGQLLLVKENYIKELNATLAELLQDSAKKCSVSYSSNTYLVSGSSTGCSTRGISLDNRPLAGRMFSLPA